jgi:hypothetical protein
LLDEPQPMSSRGAEMTMNASGLNDTGPPLES